MLVRFGYIPILVRLIAPGIYKIFDDVFVDTVAFTPNMTLWILIVIQLDVLQCSRDGQ